MREEDPKWAGPPLGACGTKGRLGNRRLEVAVVQRQRASLALSHHLGERW